MASATEIHGATEIQSAALAKTVRVDGDTVRVEGAPSRQTYYLLWRTGPSYPWHSEEFDNRTHAHRRFFALVERGVEAYLEKRPSRPA